jgi:hypothetical protein
VHASQLAIAGDAGAKLHRDLVAAAVAVEHFFPGQADFHRAFEYQ